MGLTASSYLMVLLFHWSCSLSEDEDESGILIRFALSFYDESV
jgi:hypothetical protein